MVKRLLRPLHRWPAVQSLFVRFKRHFMAWPAEDLGTYTHSTSGVGLGGAYGAPHAAVESMQPRPSSSPGAVEMHFMQLHAEGRFEEMWEMLADDAQHAWGSIQDFVREMPRLDQWLEILEMQVASIAMLESWTDQVHQRTYDNVARLVMRYKVRQEWREWSFDRQVHLVPAPGGWRTLCYPTRPRAAATR